MLIIFLNLMNKVFSRNFDIISQNFDLITCNFDIITQFRLNILKFRHLEILTQDLEFSTYVKISTY